VARTELSRQLAGDRAINAQHLFQYLKVLKHEDGLKLLIGWLRDNMDPEIAQDFLNAAGDDLSDSAKTWTPAPDEEDGRRLAWWAREIGRDRELDELFKILSARAGYRPRRTITGPVKRRRR
jgi:hypothetical protein